MRHRQFQVSILVAAVLCALLGTRVSAQMGRVGGIVRDDAGQPVKGATVTAEDPNVGQALTATTDDKGRFTIIGLRSGLWQFTARAPGYSASGGDLSVRTGPNPPMLFSLRRTAASMFGALAGVAAKDLQAELAVADALFTNRKWDEAIAAYRAIGAKAPALSAIRLQIAAAYRNKKDYDRALATYQELLQADPGNEKAIVAISEVSLDRGDAGAAEQMLLKVTESATAGREVFYSLAEVKFAKGETDEAMRWYEKAAVTDPAWGKPVYKMGLCALKKGDKPGAARLMGRVIEIDPASPEAAFAKSALESVIK